MPFAHDASTAEFPKLPCRLGYNVIFSRTGTGAIDQCTVTEVRPGQTYSRTVSGIPGHLLGTPEPNIATTVTNKTALVTLAC